VALADDACLQPTSICATCGGETEEAAQPFGSTGFG